MLTYLLYDCFCMRFAYFELLNVAPFSPLSPCSWRNSELRQRRIFFPFLVMWAIWIWRELDSIVRDETALINLIGGGKNSISFHQDIRISRGGNFLIKKQKYVVFPENKRRCSFWNVVAEVGGRRLEAQFDSVRYPNQPTNDWFTTVPITLKMK